MPWHAQVCPFCQINYANKAGLHKHLGKYVGELRLPSDGVPDVLKIQKILFPEPGGDAAKQYKCPQCSKVITGKQPFINHIVYKIHYGPYHDAFVQDVGEQKHTRGRTHRGSWILPFDESVALIPKRKGTFKFLNLPYELRHIIYEYVLHFEQVEIRATARITLMDPPKNGIWLQSNPENNPLALLSVNRQIYEEARRVFYGRNTFNFETMELLPVFLIGIGRENTKLLRKVDSAKFFDDDNYVDFIRSSAAETKEDGTVADIWNDDKVYSNFLYTLLPGALIDYSYADRLFRPDEDRETDKDVRRRYTILVHYVYDHGYKAVEDFCVNVGTASWELYGAM